jgi:hypothetical protein
MERRKKATTLKEKVMQENMDQVNDIPDEKTELELLKKQFVEQSRQFEKLQKQMSNLLETKKLKPESEQKPSKDSYVKVMSLSPNILNLATLGNGRGKVFTFRRFGEVKRILEDDLMAIIENNRSFLEQGLFYIMDKETIRLNGLDDLYEKILTKEKIDNIMNGDNQTDAVTVFASGTDKQQDMICDMFVKQIFDGKEVDLNLTDRLSRVMQNRIKGYDIRKRAEEARAYADMK